MSSPAEARGREVVDAIVPALWTRLDREKLPHVAQSVQFDHKFLGERYCSEGFYGIMKLQNYRADYQRAVHKLAERIIAIGDESGMLPRRGRGLPGPASRGPPPGKAFQAAGLRVATERVRPGEREADRERPAPDSGAGPRRLDAPLGRTPDYYGATPYAWSRTGRTIRSQSPTTRQELAKKCLDCKPFVGAFRRRHRQVGQ